MKRVPITNNFTEDVFIDCIGEVEAAVNLARETFVLSHVDGGRRARSCGWAAADLDLLA